MGISPFQPGVAGYAGLGQGGPEAGHPLGGAGDMRGSVEEQDPAVAPGDEVLGGQTAAFEVIAHHRLHLRPREVPADEHEGRLLAAQELQVVAVPLCGADDDPVHFAAEGQA